MVDELSRWLRNVPAALVSAVLPHEVYALVRLFPVLGRVSIAAKSSTKDIFDPQELRSRALAALRELLWAIGRRRPLVLYIDDLQWLDSDTTTLLGYLLAQRGALPGLVIFSHRDDGADPSGMLQTILDVAPENPALAVRHLRVGPLPESAVYLLAERCLDAGEDDPILAGVIREAQGSPFFVGELARFARRRGSAQLDRISLEGALADHVAELPESARALLELLALAGQPLPSSVAIAAASAIDGHGALDLLRAEQLVRGRTGHDGVRRIECYHDRVREGVSKSLGNQRRAELYIALARALEARDDADPELLATCYEGAGERERAALLAEQSGDRAVSGLGSSERRGSSSARSSSAATPPHARRALQIKLAEALVGAGRARDAAHRYREAAVSAEPGLSIELKRKAAYHLMTAGYVDEGRTSLAEVLSAIGLRLPGSPSIGLLRALLSRARLSLRGLSPRTEPTARTPDQARTLEALWTVVRGSAGTDPFVTVDMHARYLALALDAGSALHAARGLSYEAYLTSFSGTRGAARAESLGERALELAESAGEHEALGSVVGVQGCVAVNLGRFSESRRRLSQAAEIGRTLVPFDRCIQSFADERCRCSPDRLFGEGTDGSVPFARPWISRGPLVMARGGGAPITARLAPRFVRPRTGNPNPSTSPQPMQNYPTLSLLRSPYARSLCTRVRSGISSRRAACFWFPPVLTSASRMI